ncbi:hypothetical protein [Aeromonas sp. 602293]|uniref:hypothetical protein n=1 Tax=Aeromonas sp. 602293 TaxID=2712041 RepID=UPI003BA23F79
MFLTIPGLTPVSIAIPFEHDGYPVTDVITVEWSVRDERGHSIIAGSSVPEAGRSEVVVYIDGYLNEPRNETYTTYEVAYRLVTGSREVPGSIIYQVEAEGAVKEWKNTLITPLRALSMMREIPNMSEFAAANRDEQKAALLSAYRSMCALKFNTNVFPKEYQVIEGEKVTSLRQLTEEAWQACSAQFVSDLRIAQMIEANDSLVSPELGAMREAGVLSYTVGEVKQFVNSQRPLVVGLCPAAMRKIGRYLDTSRRIGRA